MALKHSLRWKSLHIKFYQNWFISSWVVSVAQNTIRIGLLILSDQYICSYLSSVSYHVDTNRKKNDTFSFYAQKRSKTLFGLVLWHINHCWLFNVKSCCYIYEVHTISFQTFFVWAFKIVVDSWKFCMLLLYILWDDWSVFMISASNEQLQQQLEYTLLKLDCHNWWISKMQSDTLEERYAIKFCFKLG